MRRFVLISLMTLSAVVLSDSAGAAEQTKARRSSDAALKNKSQQGRQLINAAANGDLEKVIEILKKGVNVNFTFPRGTSELSGMTALMVASSRGYSNTVAELIKHGANVNIKRYTGETALMFAAFNGDAKVIKALISAGADPNVQVVSFHAGEITPLTSVINSDREDRVEVASVLISAKAQINPTGKFLLSPLMHAVGNLEMVKLLIANGADVNQKNVRGATALMAASIDGTASVVRYLLEQGADVNASDKDGTTALMCAEGRRAYFDASDKEEIIQLLRRAQAETKPR
jgi:ankyrin repeat protein